MDVYTGAIPHLPALHRIGRRPTFRAAFRPARPAGPGGGDGQGGDVSVRDLQGGPEEARNSSIGGRCLMFGQSLTPRTAVSLAWSGAGPWPQTPACQPF